MLELGSGPGCGGAFFRDQGLQVICTDLSPAMVAHCRTKELEAHVVNFLNLALGRTFGAVYALNSLLYVPKADLSAVLRCIYEHLAPGNLFYLGVYGGNDFGGIQPDDRLEPKRFFALYRDRALLEWVTAHFEPVYFRQAALGAPRGAGFHSLVGCVPARLGDHAVCQLQAIQLISTR